MGRYPRSTVAKFEQRIDSRLRAQIRAELHRSVDQACDAWSYIMDDAACRGWPSGASGTGRGGGPIVMVESETGDMVSVAVTSVEAAAFHPDPYGTWLREWKATRSNLLRLANGALSMFSNNPELEQAKVNAIEHCILCGYEVGTANNVKIHRVGDHALCGEASKVTGIEHQACYYVVHRRAQKAGTDMVAQVALIVAQTRKRPRSVA